MNGTRLAMDWSPDTLLAQWASQRRPDLDMAETIEQFRDYWCAKPGKDATKLDWAATFRNWVRRAYALPQAPRTISPACHAPAPQEGRRKLTADEQDANKQRLANMLQEIGR